MRRDRLGAVLRRDALRPQGPERHATPTCSCSPRATPRRSCGPRSRRRARSTTTCSPCAGTTARSRAIPRRSSPWVRVATGSLGQGLSAAAGMAWARKLDGSAARVYALLGDGEVAEGSVWEAAQFASFNKLDNLCAIVDVNRLGQSGPDHVPARHGGLRRPLRGLRLGRGGGRRPRRRRAARRLRARARDDRASPSRSWRRTLKGKGVSFLEDKDGWHGKPVKKGEELQQGARRAGRHRASRCAVEAAPLPAAGAAAGGGSLDAHARLRPGPGGGHARGLRHGARQARAVCPQRGAPSTATPRTRPSPSGSRTWRPRASPRATSPSRTWWASALGHGHRGQDPVRLDLRLLPDPRLRLHPHGRLLAAAAPGAVRQPRRRLHRRGRARRRWRSRTSR